ncbi:MAG: pitrilysin family protein [Crocinitomicaceae bacterium]
MNRKEAPEYLQAKDLPLILPEEIELQNGVRLFWMKDVKDDSVKMEVLWDAGTKHQQKSLQASFTNKLLLSGSKERSAKQISEALDYYGGYVQKELDKDHAGISVYGLNEHIADIFGIIQNALATVSFEENELQKELSIGKNRFKVDTQKVNILSRRAFTKQLFGEDAPYGQVAELADFEQLKREDLLAYYDRFYYQSPVIFLTGNVSQAFIEVLRTWSVNFRQEEIVMKKQQFSPTIGRVDVPKKEALQSAIRIGRLMFDKKHEDYYPFQLLNTIFGGYFGSRLMTNIREDKGYTYGVGSGMSVLADAGYLFVATEVGSDVKELAVKEIYHEMQRLQTELIPYEELEKVKNYMLGEFQRNADGPLSMMEMFKNIYFNELPKTYYSDFIQAIHQVTPEQLRTLAEKYLQQDEMLEVIAG